MPHNSGTGLANIPAPGRRRNGLDAARPAPSELRCWPRSATSAPNMARTRPRCWTSTGAFSMPLPNSGRTISSSGMSSIRASTALAIRASKAARPGHRPGRRCATSLTGRRGRFQVADHLVEGVGRHHLAHRAPAGRGYRQRIPLLHLLGVRLVDLGGRASSSRRPHHPPPAAPWRAAARPPWHQLRARRPAFPGVSSSQAFLVMISAPTMGAQFKVQHVAGRAVDLRRQREIRRRRHGVDHAGLIAGRMSPVSSGTGCSRGSS